MMCEKVYQSVRCCELPDERTTPSQSFTYPQGQIGGCPKRNKTLACRARSSAIPMNGRSKYI
jgi:hypothetical protein